MRFSDRSKFVNLFCRCHYPGLATANVIGIIKPGQPTRIGRDYANRILSNLEIFKYFDDGTSKGLTSRVELV